MAASAVKIIANRANASKSTGPVDTSKTRLNGIAHGLTSKQTVIPGESQEEYDTFAAGLRKDLRPASAIENVLSDRLISAAWRLQRFTRVESAFLSNRIDAYMDANPNSNPDAAFANMFVDPAEAARMRLFMRYQAATRREYDKAFKEFQAAKAERRKRERELAMLERLSDLQESSNEDTINEDAPNVGFASQAAIESTRGFASQPLAFAA